MLQNVLREIETVGIGQVDIHQDKGRTMCFDIPQSGGTTWRFNDWKARKRALDTHANRFAHWRVIINDQYGRLKSDTIWLAHGVSFDGLGILTIPASQQPVCRANQTDHVRPVAFVGQSDQPGGVSPC